jgi:DNA-binding transcriptional ArsR family regulator
MVNYRSGSLDEVFAALADPIRRGIVARLARGEASVGDLAAPYRVSAPAISRHLRVLENAGLLERHKRGRVHHCRLRPQPMSAAAEWIEQCREFWESRFDALEKYLQQTQSQTPKESASWPQPAPARRRNSSSAARSKQRAKRSSKPGPNPSK